MRLLLASVAMVLVTVTCVVSLVPILISLGHSRAASAEIAGLIGITTVLGRIVGGYLIDRLNGNGVAAVTIASPIVACLLLLALPSSLPAVVAAVMILGLSLGAELDAVAYLTARHFGLRSFGVLFASIGGLQGLATGLGPFLVSGIYDATGSYRVALWLFIPICLMGALLFLSLGPYPEFEPSGDSAPADALAGGSP
jgi:nitrate/nitrite transporter NarK